MLIFKTILFHSAEAAARFINWLNSVSGVSPANYHIVGYSVGGHGAGIMARNVNGNVGYVTGKTLQSFIRAEILQTG